MTEAARLKKFVQDQEEAVQIARAMPEGSNVIRVDALNIALSLAHCNAEDGVFVTVDKLLRDAALIEQYISKN